MSGGLTCKQLVMLISEYFEGTLPDAARARFDEHISGCGNCAEYLNQLRTTIRLVGGLREEDLTLGARETLVAAFRGWKAAGAGG